MDKQELIFIGLGVAALAAVIIWRNQMPTGIIPVNDSQVETTAKGPSWLVYNAPWGMNAALGNVLPSRSIGQVGQVGNQGAAENFTYNPMNDCGC